MIARIWQGRASKATADDYQHHYEAQVAEHLQQVPGFCGARLLRRNDGDEVTFTLKYSNQGGRDISDVAVSDSLTARLEYIPGSAQSSRNAVFSSSPNESGSLALRWQINGVLQPGDSGVVRFKARIR